MVKKWALRVFLVLLGAALIFAAYAFYQLRSRGFLRLPSYETSPPAIPPLPGRPAILVFSKTGAFIHKEAIPAAEAMFTMLAEKNGWSVFITENGAVHNPEDLAKFDTVIWNNATGNVINESQQQALVDYLAGGGGWIGIHGAGDSSSDWEWYNRELIGAEFIGHPMNPQFQQARIVIERPGDSIVAHLGSEWIRTDEWYSYADSPRKHGKIILANLDEASYSPFFFDEDIRMGDDHPIIWKHCPGAGRAFYSALGHTAESFTESAYVTVLEKAVLWTTGREGRDCRD